MRYTLVAVALALIGCGDDVASAAMDLLSPADVADMTSPPDLTSPGDFSVARCDLPKPLVYQETLQYLFSSNGGGPVGTYNYTPAAVDQTGRITRPKIPLTSPSSYRCSFTEKDIDPSTCTAPCCPSTTDAPQPLSPTVYVDTDGWTLWMGGSCTFTINAAIYVATITSITTNRAH